MCAFLAQRFAEVLATLFVFPQTGSGPINEVSAPFLAKASAFALPECP